MAESELDQATRERDQMQAQITAMANHVQVLSDQLAHCRQALTGIDTMLRTTEATMVQLVAMRDRAIRQVTGAESAPPVRAP